MIDTITPKGISFNVAKAKLLKLGYTLHGVLDSKNKSRYELLNGEPPILLIYKTRFYETYQKRFGHLGKKGMGESINKEHLESAERLGCKLIARIDDDYNLLLCSLSDFKDERQQWKNKEGVVVYSNEIVLFKNINNYASFETMKKDILKENQKTLTIY